MAELRVKYSPDDQWTGELEGVVASNGFPGRGSAWFDRTHLRTAIIPAFRAFPLSDSEPPTIEGGFWSKERQGELEQCHLRITVKQHNARGGLLVRVDVASQVWKTPDADMQQTVTARFLTDYEALRQFAEDLERVLDGALEEAVLRNTTM